MSNPTPCDPNVFANGQPVLIVDTGAVGGSHIFEEWVKALAAAAGCPVDWHYSGGRAQVLTTGDPAAVMAVAQSLMLTFPADPAGEPMQVLRWCGGSGGLYRRGVDGVPVEAHAVDAE